MESFKAFLKDNWFIVVILLLATGFLWNKQNNFEEVVQIQNTARVQEVETLKKFHAIQLEEANKLIEEHQQETERLKKQYAHSRWQLANERKKKIQVIIKESPEEVATRIEDAWGFERVE